MAEAARGYLPEVTTPPSGDTEIVVCPDGPLLVRGDVAIRDADGRDVPRRRATVALCRCGATGIPPWCDGSHKLALAAGGRP